MTLIEHGEKKDNIDKTDILEKIRKENQQNEKEKKKLKVVVSNEKAENESKKEIICEACEMRFESTSILKHISRSKTCLDK